MPRLAHQLGSLGSLDLRFLTHSGLAKDSEQNDAASRRQPVADPHRVPAQTEAQFPHPSPRFRECGSSSVVGYSARRSAFLLDLPIALRGETRKPETASPVPARWSSARPYQPLYIAQMVWAVGSFQAPRACGWRQPRSTRSSSLRSRPGRCRCSSRSAASRCRNSRPRPTWSQASRSSTRRATATS